jgi:hypothetical protein
MKKYLPVLLFLIAFGAEAQVSNPDLSIENKLELLQPKGIEKQLGSQQGKLIEDEKPSRVQLLNTGKNEYLIMYHLAGANANSFNVFEIGRPGKNTAGYTVTTFNSFATNEGVALGMTMENLIESKGPYYAKYMLSGYTILKYTINDPKSALLKKYAMPLYKAEYYFKNDQLEKFTFGFPSL